MKLFHGTNIIIEKPRILIPNRALDFGAGFYLTSDFAQAARWAKLVVLRADSGLPLIHEYCFDMDNLNKLKTKRFESASREWLDFVCDHRLDIYEGDDFDLVIGPVANDRTMRVIQAYMSATDRDLYAPVALNDIRADKLSDQYVFRSERALNVLRLLDVREA
ncbi:MAG: DUF3990 domain-containing protein [Coriobacteriales bacterium]|jgi:hypothetical protein|nr:DUF3990 domain-containing protein [Coriobacteriales bacterium]